MKDVSYEVAPDYKAQSYSNQGAWFGGQAAKVLLDGCKTGDVVTLTMKVKTSQDGTSAGNYKLYQSYADSEWVGNVADGFSDGVVLNAAGESGWREIQITVTLKQDGYVWLAVSNTSPSAACEVSIKDVAVKA